uniref:Lipase 1 n=1 Tax=Cacopsylla melanoneura TaxID=428564 RepID=A0A8D8Q8U7_9HEMI
MIDYILNLTGHKSLISIGHSMGTNNVLIATSLRPEYEPKVTLNVLLAPTPFLSNIVTGQYLDILYTTYKRYSPFDGHQQSLAAKGSEHKEYIDFFCNPTSLFKTLCYTGVGFASGWGSNQTDPVSVMKMMTKFPYGTSLNVGKQLIQIIRSGEFKPLSYTKKENLRRYGTPEPSPYPIGKVNVPTAIYYGCCNDFLSSSKDARKLKRRLGNVVRDYPVPYKYFDHGDFLWAKDAYRLLYKDILLLVDQYTPWQYRSNVPLK